MDRLDRHAEPYFRADLALVHHLGFGFHADGCAPRIIEALGPVRRRGGLVLELGCGSGRLTQHLVAAGHRVIATDASPAMLDLAREAAPGAEEFRRLVLPDDVLPQADAVVSVGHVLSCLADETSLQRALAAAAQALSPGGIIALDLCDLRWGEARRDAADQCRVEDDWTLISRFSVPDRTRFVREMTTFVRVGEDAWRRDDERHDNVLVDTSQVPAQLARHGVAAVIETTLGDYELPDGLVAIIGTRANQG
ncbi:MAG TPA: class I SAM-dependent methyltransferase [Egibacteraceae bacterium]|nr:class I SAM-dependent methyltransferase [Egibacteraceae bacterium]